MDWISALLGIIVIDLVLSGDNAVVIGLAAHRLPPRQRRTAIFIGGAAAIVLRVTLTAVASLLLTWPALKAIGGILLLWISFKLLEQEEEEHEGHSKVASSMLGAISTILIADFVMSLDNVLGVAAAEHGDLLLLGIGLVLSMAILMLGGSLTASLMNRFGWLVYLGAGVIAWVGAEMLLGDPLVHDRHIIPANLELLVVAVIAAATLALAHWMHRMLPSASARQNL